MLLCATPYGTTLRLAETDSEEKSYFTSNDLDSAAGYYAEQGYVVLRGLIPALLCDDVRVAFDQEVRRARTPIPRQTNMQYEQNTFNADGFLVFPNLQCAGFADYAIRTIQACMPGPPDPRRSARAHRGMSQDAENQTYPEHVF